MDAAIAIMDEKEPLVEASIPGLLAAARATMATENPVAFKKQELSRIQDAIDNFTYEGSSAEPTAADIAALAALDTELAAAHAAFRAEFEIAGNPANSCLDTVAMSYYDDIMRPGVYTTDARPAYLFASYSTPEEVATHASGWSQLCVKFLVDDKRYAVGHICKYNSSDAECEAVAAGLAALKVSYDAAVAGIAAGNKYVLKLGEDNTGCGSVPSVGTYDDSYVIGGSRDFNDDKNIDGFIDVADIPDAEALKTDAKVAWVATEQAAVDTKAADLAVYQTAIDGANAQIATLNGEKQTASDAASAAEDALNEHVVMNGGDSSMSDLEAAYASSQSSYNAIRKLKGVRISRDNSQSGNSYYNPMTVVKVIDSADDSLAATAKASLEAFQAAQSEADAVQARAFSMENVNGIVSTFEAKRNGFNSYDTVKLAACDAVTAAAQAAADDLLARRTLARSSTAPSEGTLPAESAATDVRPLHAALIKACKDLFFPTAAANNYYPVSDELQAELEQAIADATAALAAAKAALPADYATVWYAELDGAQSDHTIAGSVALRKEHMDKESAVSPAKEQALSDNGLLEFSQPGCFFNSELKRFETMLTTYTTYNSAVHRETALLPCELKSSFSKTFKLPLTKAAVSQIAYGDTGDYYSDDVANFLRDQVGASSDIMTTSLDITLPKDFASDQSNLGDLDALFDSACETDNVNDNTQAAMRACFAAVIGDAFGACDVMRGCTIAWAPSATPISQAIAGTLMAGLPEDGKRFAMSIQDLADTKNYWSFPSKANADADPADQCTSGSLKIEMDVYAQGSNLNADGTAKMTAPVDSHMQIFELGTNYRRLNGFVKSCNAVINAQTSQPIKDDQGRHCYRLVLEAPAATDLTNVDTSSDIVNFCGPPTGRFNQQFHHSLFEAGSVTGAVHGLISGDELKAIVPSGRITEGKSSMYMYAPDSSGSYGSSSNGTAQMGNMAMFIERGEFVDRAFVDGSILSSKTVFGGSEIVPTWTNNAEINATTGAYPGTDTELYSDNFTVSAPFQVGRGGWNAYAYGSTAAVYIQNADTEEILSGDLRALGSNGWSYFTNADGFTYDYYNAVDMTPEGLTLQPGTNYRIKVQVKRALPTTYKFPMITTIQSASTNHIEEDGSGGNAQFADDATLDAVLVLMSSDGMRYTRVGGDVMIEAGVGGSKSLYYYYSPASLDSIWDIDGMPSDGIRAGNSGENVLSGQGALLAPGSRVMNLTSGSNQSIQCNDEDNVTFAADFAKAGDKLAIFAPGSDISGVRCSEMYKSMSSGTAGAAHVLDGPSIADGVWREANIAFKCSVEDNAEVIRGIEGNHGSNCGVNIELNHSGVDASGTKTDCKLEIENKTFEEIQMRAVACKMTLSRNGQAVLTQAPARVCVARDYCGGDIYGTKNRSLSVMASCIHASAATDFKSEFVVGAAQEGGSVKISPIAGNDNSAQSHECDSSKSRQEMSEFMALRNCRVGDGQQTFCSASQVGRGLFVTANHCIDDNNSLGDKLSLHFETRDRTDMVVSAELISSSPDLEMAVLRLREIPAELDVRAPGMAHCKDQLPVQADDKLSSHAWSVNGNARYMEQETNGADSMAANGFRPNVSVSQGKRAPGASGSGLFARYGVNAGRFAGVCSTVNNAADTNQYAPVTGAKNRLPADMFAGHAKSEAGVLDFASNIGCFFANGMKQQGHDLEGGFVKNDASFTPLMVAGNGDAKKAFTHAGVALGASDIGNAAPQNCDISLNKNHIMVSDVKFTDAHGNATAPLNFNRGGSKMAAALSDAFAAGYVAMTMTCKRNHVGAENRAAAGAEAQVNGCYNGLGAEFTHDSEGNALTFELSLPLVGKKSLASRDSAHFILSSSPEPTRKSKSNEPREKITKPSSA